MAGNLCEPLKVVVEALRASKVAFALVHESALMGWGIDNNAFLGHVDVLLAHDEDFSSFKCEQPNAPGVYAAMEIADVPVRFWSRASLGIKGPFEVTSCTRYGCEALAPEVVLKKLPYSPEARMLLEQRARLASILFAEDLTEDELSLVARYVRGN